MSRLRKKKRRAESFTAGSRPWDRRQLANYPAGWASRRQKIETALLALESDGIVLRGEFTGARGK